MRILLYGNYHGGKQYFDELSEWLTQVGNTVDFFDWGSYTIYFNHFSTSTTVNKSMLQSFTKIKFIRRYAKIKLIRKTFKLISERYDIINIHFGSAYNNHFLDLLQTKGKKLVVTIWGSDYHRVPDKKRQEARKLYDVADIINFGNPVMRDDFVDYFGAYQSKTTIAGFGNNEFQLIDNLMNTELREKSRKQLNIPSDRFIITCGYKAYDVLQHHKMLDAIEKIRDFLPANYLLVFPLTYHRNETYLEGLNKRLLDSGLDYVTFNSFLTNEEVARLRISSDIYITISKTDAASSSLLEYLMSGNVVIAGDWLPYSYHRKLGLEFYSESIENVSHRLKDIITNYSEYKKKTEKNRKIVLEHFSWPTKIQEWQRMFESDITKSSLCDTKKTYN